MKLKTLVEIWACEKCGFAWRATQPFPAEMDPEEVAVGMFPPLKCRRCEGAMKFHSREVRKLDEGEDQSDD
jgi:hypothetical protein